MVRQRAEERCEYCLMPDRALDLPFHVEHVVANVHRVDNRPTNLAWACPRCNLRKGPNLSAMDPTTGSVVELFNPRTMVWHEHFVIHEGTIDGLTPCGRGTVQLLDMNQEQRVHHRRKLIDQGMFLAD